MIAGLIVDPGNLDAALLSPPAYPGRIFFDCVFGLRVLACVFWPACLACVFGLRVRPARLVCAFGLRVWRASSAAVFS
jgi:hypothetical protein